MEHTTPIATVVKTDRRSTAIRVLASAALLLTALFIVAISRPAADRENTINTAWVNDRDLYGHGTHVASIAAGRAAAGAPDADA